MPPFGPRRNPFAPPSRRRLPRWLTSSLLPALVGGAVVLGGAAATGKLGGGTETIREIDTAPLPAAVAGSRPQTPVDPSAGARPGSVQRIVREGAPAVVKVTSGDEDAGGRVGSGFLVDGRRRILTNAHVLEAGAPARVTFDDGTEGAARVLGRDESTDLAVLLADDVPAGVRPLALGRSADLAVGDGVVAIGNPFGLERTATVGIVSALKRTITAPNGFAIQNVIQTDAAINRGNSGGPLLDRRGRVIGINAQIATGSGGNDGIGFAVPIDTIRPVADAIIATGEPRHAWLGVTGRTLTPAMARALGAPQVRGVAIVGVDERGPAARAGLRAARDPEADTPRGGDLIVAVDGRPVEDMADVSRAVSSRAVGDSLSVTILREGRRQTLRVALASRPGDVGVRPEAERPAP